MKTPSNMLKLEELLEVTEKDKLTVYKEFDINSEKYQESRNAMYEYIDQSEHLPKDYDVCMITGSIVNNKANIHDSKKFLENYFRCKNDYADVIFNHCVPTSTKYEETKKYTVNVCCRKLTPKGCRVQYWKLADPDGKVENAFIYLMGLVMMIELRATYDFFTSTIFVIDAEHVTFKHLMKYSTQWAFAAKDLLESIHFRVQKIHVINGPPIIGRFLELLRVVLPAKLQDRLEIHKNHESLQREIAKECLPEDLGGTDMSIQKLKEEWDAVIENMEPFYQKLRAAKSTKKYELDENQKESLGLGVEGTFKKLQID